MIGFRVDANEVIATGHLMRCMAIAKGFQKQGEEVMFFLAEEKETNRLKAQNIPYTILHSKWNVLEQEIPDLKQSLKKYHITKLIVDSYQVTVPYLESLNQCVKVIYIDDMGEVVYPVSAVIHYSNWEWDTTYEERYKGTDILCMSGMKYTPLREEFYPNEEKAEEIDIEEKSVETEVIDDIEKHESVNNKKENNTTKNTGNKKNILITTGGTDQYNIAGRLLEYFINKNMSKQQNNFRQNNIQINNMHFLVISGSMNQNKSFLEKLANENETITLYENVNNMGELMRNSYLAVSAGGTTLYELCACRVPTVCFSFADNQEGFTNEMGTQGVMCYAGDARKREDIIENIYENLMKLWNDEQLCGQYQKKMGRLVDGKGVERIVERVYYLP